MTFLRRTASLLVLARWLGPWADPGFTPPVAQEERSVPLSGDRGAMRVRFYLPVGRPIGSVYFVPGMHFLGPDHPRLGRVAGALARSGLLVAVPFVPDPMEFRFDPRSIDDVRRGFESLWEHPLRPELRPGVMGVSFASRLAIGLAGSPDHCERIGGLLTFGGYADWRASFLFGLRESDGVVPDPLSRPVVFGAVAEEFDHEGDLEAIIAAWREYCRRTWGTDEPPTPEERAEVAAQLGAGLVGTDETLFLQGCGLQPGGEAAVEAVLERSRRLAWLDPFPDLARLRCPFVAVHAADDDVIPPDQCGQLIEGAPGAIDSRALWIGLYGHSGQGAPGPGRRSWPSEMITMLRVLRALCGVGTEGLP